MEKAIIVTYPDAVANKMLKTKSVLHISWF